MDRVNAVACAELAATVSAVEPPAVVVVGAGPVGVRFTQELNRRQPFTRIVVLSAEPWVPYNRVRLSAALAGETSWANLQADMRLPDGPHVIARFGCAVTAIDREQKRVRDAMGREQPYTQLVLAVGSSPHVPDILGMGMPGVFTFRDMNDAQQLVARRVRSRTTVVLGGGLLGLEAARAMRRFHTDVWVVEHLDRLLSRQIDTAGGELVQRHVEQEGIHVVLGDGVTRVMGSERVEGVRLRSGREIVCDTLIVATGIRPNLQLARRAGLAVGRGIRVNDELRTSDPAIFAVGECAEHRDRLYGIVAPGLEQAAVAAQVIAGGKASYAGTHAATRLKVVSCPVFSIGETGNEGLTNMDWSVVHRDRDRTIYRKVVLRRGRITGAVAVGDLPELSRIQEAVVNHRRIYPWQVARFRRHGRLWSEGESDSVVQWPAAATVCNCTGVTRGALGDAMAAGCRNVADLANRTGASTVCGSCKPLLVQLVGGVAKLGPERGWQWLAGAAGAALPAVLALLLLLVPYSLTVQVPWQWDVLWREGLWKQVSGFTVAGLALALSVLSLRKRIRRFKWGDFPLWRIAHALLGALTLVVLAVHTGGRLGSNLNLMLMTSFLGVIAVGAVAGGVIALEHRIGSAARLRRTWLWTHILFAWPIPVLLVLHVIKSYYF